MNFGVTVSERQADYLDNELSTAQTVQEMCGLIAAAAKDPLVRAVALECGATPESVWAWVKKNVRFETDEAQLWRTLRRRDELELLISPSVLLRAKDRAGDCDDFTMLLCSMLLCLGVQPLIKTFKCDRREPWRWAHVCAVAVIEDGSLMTLDASHGKYPGWEVPPQDQFETALWDMAGDRISGVQGMERTRARGLAGYTADPNWTGTPETTVTGPHAGIYPSRDATRYWSRAAGLGAIARGKYRGMGQDASTYDPSTDTTSSGLDALAFPDSGMPAAPAGSTVLTAPWSLSDIFSGGGSAGGSSSTSSSGFNLNSLLGPLLGSASTLTAAALQQPGAQLLANGSVLLPNGTIVPAASSSSSTLLLIGGVVLLVLVLAMGKK